jgi:hypothetical protein
VHLNDRPLDATPSIQASFSCHSVELSVIVHSGADNNDNHDNNNNHDNPYWV